MTHSFFLDETSFSSQKLRPPIIKIWTCPDLWGILQSDPKTQMGLLFRNKIEMHFQECKNRWRCIARFVMFSLPDRLQIWTKDARESDLTDDDMEIGKFCTVALRRTPKVKWDYYFGTEGVLVTSLYICIPSLCTWKI